MTSGAGEAGLAAAFGLALSACGGGVGGDRCPPALGAAICASDAKQHQPACDLASGLDCSPGLGKCTLVSEGPDGNPLIACAPLLGDEAGLGERCERVMDLGRFFDNCAPTLFCRNAICVQLCDLEAPACPVGLTCTMHPDLFLEGGTVWAGLCE